LKEKKVTHSSDFAIFSVLIASDEVRRASIDIAVILPAELDKFDLETLRSFDCFQNNDLFALLAHVKAAPNTALES